jgi:hypothetical protein
MLEASCLVSEMYIFTTSSTTFFTFDIKYVSGSSTLKTARTLHFILYPVLIYSACPSSTGQFSFHEPVCRESSSSHASSPSHNEIHQSFISICSNLTCMISETHCSSSNSNQTSQPASIALLRLIPTPHVRTYISTCIPLPSSFATPLLGKHSS